MFNKIDKTCYTFIGNEPEELEKRNKIHKEFIGEISQLTYLYLNKGANPGNLQTTLIAAAMQIGINFGRDAHLITIVTILSALLKETEKMMEFIPYEDEGEQNAKH